MNEEIVRALLRVKHAIKDNVLTNADLVDTFLKDMFPDDKYVGDRMLLLTLMREGLPLKAKDGHLDDETAQDAEARRIAQTYHMDEDWVRKALLTWRYVVQADESMTASAHVDADFLQLLSGSVPELKEVDAPPVSDCVDESLSQPLSDPLPNLKEMETSSVSAPQTAGGGRKGRGRVLWLLAGLTVLSFVWHFAWYSVTGESSSSYLARKRHAAKRDAAFATVAKGTAEQVREAFASGAIADASGWLMFAAMNPNPEVVKVLLENGADIHARNEYGWTALMWAAAMNPNSGVAKALLEAGADVNAKEKDGKTALFYAVGKNSIKVLLAGGADIDARDKDGKTALMYAAGKDNANPEVVKALLENGADVHARDKDGKTALMWAANNLKPKRVKMLLEGGANVRAVDKEGHNAIWWAQQKGSIAPQKIIIQLLEKYAFLELCEHGTVDEVRKALDSGSNANARDTEGKTALMWAASRNSNPEVVKTLLESGADIHARENTFGRTALMEAAGKNTNPEVVKVLLKGKADIHARTKWGRMGVTALMHAAAVNPNPEVVKVLLASGADIHARDKDGVTTLMWAAGFNSNLEVVKVLLEAGVDVNAKEKYGGTALMYAAEWNSNPEMVKMLLEAGADVRAVDKEGHDALWCAERREKKDGQEKIIQILKEYTSAAR